MTKESEILKLVLSEKLNEILEKYFENDVVVTNTNVDDILFSFMPFVILHLYQIMVLFEGKELADLIMEGIQEHEIKYDKEKFN